MPVKVRPNGNYKCRMAASGWHPAHFTQKTCSFQVKTGLLHPLILKQMRQPLVTIYQHNKIDFIGTYSGTVHALSRA
jgi:hypothetical protein